MVKSSLFLLPSPTAFQEFSFPVSSGVLPSNGRMISTGHFQHASLAKSKSVQPERWEEIVEDYPSGWLPSGVGSFYRTLSTSWANWANQAEMHIWNLKSILELREADSYANIEVKCQVLFHQRVWKNMTVVLWPIGYWIATSVQCSANPHSSLPNQRLKRPAGWTVYISISFHWICMVA